MDEQEKKPNPGFKLLEKTKKKIRPLHIIVAAVLLLVIAAAIFLTTLPVPIAEWFSTKFASSSNAGFPCSLSDYGSAKSVSVCSDYYIVLTDSNVISVDKNGGVVNATSHGYADCVIKSSDHRFIVFNRKSTGYQIHNATKKLNDSSADGNIVTADIANDGTYAIVSDTNEVVVFNDEFEKIYKFKSAEKSIVDVDISGKGGRVAVASVNTQNGKIVSTIQAYKLNSEEAVTRFSFDGLALDIEQNGSDIIVIGDNRCAVYNSDGETIGEFDYKGKVLSAIEQNSSNILLAISDSVNSQQKTLYLLSTSASVNAQISCDKSAKAYGIGAGKIYVLSDNLYAYNNDGKLTDSYELPPGASDFAVNGSSVVAVGYDQIDRLIK